MYVRDAKNREEVWLLDHIESMGLDDTAFRSRDYVLAIDEHSGEKAGFGRIRIHKVEGDGDRDEVCELTSIGVLEGWRGQGVGAHVVERLVEYAGDDGFETVYALTGEGAYLAQFGFQRMEESVLPAPLRERLDAKRNGVDPDAVAYALAVDEFRMPQRLREAFKHAPEQRSEDGDEESPEDFGIDPDSATYKYDTGQ
ncbi:GNAT family N-acetyltransferase [Natronobacterium gregoryi]|uniref:Acetyltransferase, N-acetylglutamate synthase n=2 Tax=Natronobacterium gregoryi TaxID=44930 RepID=L0AMG6_NATGS|nr:GNAT family N-acetyltransferase [Natronobacterium gregoryi]AFZ74245.1 acetyltransferase, N-acetylglutamate synthase [Natronobacterium gregoryi SP2]ELY63703.1 GCN5-related N-acetyltransferase [Natronobacterium gregoryi SP2]PLK21970.1 GNAT family N-acetyltransferase [Natronobacterium gregoryi SP2]SFI52247.1 N-acetylglutamate synthase, GNAT family [Natronobacterium gregoryi]